MGDADNTMPPSKKRAAGKQLSRDDDPDAEEDACGLETGTFQRASEEILANRRIVKVRRNTTSSSGAANPFAGIRLVPPTAPPSVGVDRQPPVVQDEEASKDKDKLSDGKSMNEAMPGFEIKKADSTLCEAEEVCETKVADVNVNGGDSKGKEAPSKITEASKENEDENKDSDRESVEKNLHQSTENKETTKEESAEEVHTKVLSQQEPSVAVSSFQQLSSTQNAFAGISGTGFSSSSFTFGLLPKPGTSTTVSFGSAFSPGSFTGTGALFGTKTPGSDGSSPSASNGGTSIRLFGAPALENVTSSGSGLPTLQEVPVETGEEKEKAVFTADSVLFEYIGGAWKERGKGELKINLSTADTGKARLVMRSKGNYRLILNANLFPDMKLTNMDKRGITFVCVNSAGEAKESLSTFALKFKDSSIVEQFRGIVETNKGNTSGDLKTPENSPKASEV